MRASGDVDKRLHANGPVDSKATLGRSQWQASFFCVRMVDSPQNTCLFSTRSNEMDCSSLMELLHALLGTDTAHGHVHVPHNSVLFPPHHFEESLSTVRASGIAGPIHDIGKMPGFGSLRAVDLFVLFGGVGFMSSP